MEIDDPKIRQPLEKVLRAMKKDRALLCRRCTSWNDQRITAENLGDLAGNHLFDDEPNLFGITEEGLRLRSYLTGCANAPDYEWVKELHLTFPDVMEDEKPGYLEGLNKYRRNKGLNPIALCA